MESASSKEDESQPRPIEAAVDNRRRCSRTCVHSKHVLRIERLAHRLQWSKRLILVDRSAGLVTAQFDDGTTCTGIMLVGCDGSLSRVREICYPLGHQTYKLPIRLLGVTVQHTAPQVHEVLQLDPFFFQGSDPRSDSYLWFSCTSTVRW